MRRRSAADTGQLADSGGVADPDVVRELGGRVATRLTATGEGYAGLDAEAQALRVRTLVLEEIEAWMLHRTGIGRQPPSVADEDALADAVVASLSGLGRLEPLLRRDDVEDIFFNGTAPVMLRLEDGSKMPGPPIANSNQELVELIQRLASTLGDGVSREFSAARPLLAVRLQSVGGALGARLNAANDITAHPAGTIRIHRHVEGDLDLAYEGVPTGRGGRSAPMVDAPMRAFLRAAVHAGARVCVSGAMGSGKTFLLRSLCAEIPLDAMIVTVEDDRELGLHVLPKRRPDGALVLGPDGRPEPLRPAALVRAYEARPANSEGVGRVDMGDLLWHSLRDSADVIVVGETRAGDIVHMLDAATNGTAGVMATLHANSAEGVFDRIVQLVLKAQPPLPTEYALRASTALDLIVHVRRNRAHERFVSEVIEVHSGQLGENRFPVVGHLFAPRPDGRAQPTGHRPTPELMARLADVGFDPAWLDPAHCDWDRERRAAG